MQLGVDALVVIGGNGLLAGAHLLGRERPCNRIVLAIDIDLSTR
jgi:6-phosphofructokinase